LARTVAIAGSSADPRRVPPLAQRAERRRLAATASTGEAPASFLGTAFCEEVPRCFYFEVIVELVTPGGKRKRELQISAD
jgi:hypothetical protein